MPRHVEANHSRRPAGARAHGASPPGKAQGGWEGEAGVEWADLLRLFEEQDSVERLRELLLSYWPWTPLVSIFLLTLESVIAPLPAWPVIAANVYLFGPVGGFFVSWIGALTGASACFWLARALGREKIARWLGKGPVWQRVDEFTAERGFTIWLVARLIPVTNLDPLSYLAGLSRVGFPTFLLATALGTLPWVLLYTLFAHDLMRVREYGARLGVVTAVALAVYLFFRYRARRGRREDATKSGR